MTVLWALIPEMPTTFFGLFAINRRIASEQALSSFYTVSGACQALYVAVTIGGSWPLEPATSCQLPHVHSTPKVWHCVHEETKAPPKIPTNLITGDRQLRLFKTPREIRSATSMIPAEICKLGETGG